MSYHLILTTLSAGIIKCIFYPDWYGSVGRTLPPKLKGCWFDSQSGQMPELKTRSPVGGK